MWPVILLPQVKEFINSLEINVQPKATKTLNLLKEYGPLLREPHSKKIIGYKDLLELRTSGSPAIRLFYTVKQGQFYILRGFFKKTNKTPANEINLALKQISQLTTA